MAGYGNFGRKSQALIVESIQKQESFKVGTMSGVDVSAPLTGSHGQLIDTDQDTFNEFCKANEDGDLVYVVYSYETPIAWVYKDGRRTRVLHRFSQTTTGHQSMVARAWSVDW
jgi:hypothetical protein